MEAEHVAQHEHRPLARRAGTGARTRTRARPTPWPRSAPRDRGPRRRSPRAACPDTARATGSRPTRGRRPDITSCGRRALVAQRVQAAVGRDRVQPGAQRRASLELLEPAPGRQQRLLEQVLGVLQRAEDPVAVELELAPVGLGQLARTPPRRRAGRGRAGCGFRGPGSPIASKPNDTAGGRNSSVNCPGQSRVSSFDTHQPTEETRHDYKQATLGARLVLDRLADGGARRDRRRDRAVDDPAATSARRSTSSSGPSTRTR